MNPNLNSPKKLLDVGCGSGQELDRLHLENVDIYGVDIDGEALSRARTKYPAGDFRIASSETLPFENGSFDAVVSSVALPYTNIQNSVKEIHRVMLTDGYLWLSLHSFKMLLGYFVFYLVRLRLKPTIFTTYALFNGMWFHLTGYTFSFPFFPRKYESFQTKRGMRLALNRSGFRNIRFEYKGKLFVDCIK